MLSVFPASFDQPAAIAVVGTDGDVADALELLRRRSLLEWDVALARYSLHELVRVFATARLEDQQTGERRSRMARRSRRGIRRTLDRNLRSTAPPAFVGERL